MENLRLVAKDGYELSLSVYEAENARGCIQVIHGMEEHKERYQEFAEYLCAAGYTVVVSDTRGHGTDAPTLGFFKEKDGYRYLLSDQMQISDYICERFRVNQVYLFGHSMGTIIARNLLKTQSKKYKKVVLSGYPCYVGKLTILFGRFLTSVLAGLRGPKYRSKYVQEQSTGRFNKSVKNPKTNADWLSVNEENVQKYLLDPYCGQGFTVSAFHDLFMLVDGMADWKGYQNVNQQLPILMLRGEQDPSTGFDKGAKHSIDTLKKAGFAHIQAITYPNMRHEILNETEHEKVYADVVRFLRES